MLDDAKLDDLLPRRVADQRNLLLVEEPWVTAALNPMCDEQLTQQYRNVRRAFFDGSRVPGDWAVCDLGARWGFTASTLPQLVDAISREEGIDHPSGFLGTSFGSVRRTYMNSYTFDWTVLVRPFPIGASATQVIDFRAASLRGRFTDVDEVAAPIEVPSRSLAVDAFDQYSALVALGSTAGDEDVSSVTRAGDPAAAGRLSDSLWLRYGADRISPAYLAYLSELCPMTELPADAPRHDRFHTVLALALAPCGSSGLTSTTATLSLGNVEKLCAVLGTNDRVASSELGRASLPAGTKIVTSEDPSHTSLDGMDRCFAELGLGQ